MNEQYFSCRLCPRECGTNRYERIGYCQEKAVISAARAGLHFYEEPFLSGCSGSGTVFFTGCSLHCVFCQNYEISGRVSPQERFETTEERLAEIFLELQQSGAHNINLVTGTQFIPSIAKALRLVKGKELNIPVIWNSSGYERPEALGLLGGLVDIWMPDLKTLSPEFAKKYLNAEDYPGAAARAIRTMFELQPEPVFETLPAKDGPLQLMKKGVLVRHLVMPGHVRGAVAVLKYLFETYGDQIWISLMNQYTPNEICQFEEINRPISKREYDRAVNAAIDLGITNCLIQEGGTVSDSFVPVFDGTGIQKQLVTGNGMTRRSCCSLKTIKLSYEGRPEP